MASKLSDGLLSQLSDLIATQMGLTFPPNRWRDLEHGLEQAATKLGFHDVVSCGERLVSAPLAPRQIEVLARYLTVGETYFFREKKTFDLLEEQILPALIRSRRGSEQRLRIWSAGCCTGEEPYSLAILLRKLIWDWQDWQISILATDINPHFLRKASAGVYGQWSFREASPWAKERYVRPAGRDRFEILPEIRQMVTFAVLNLAADDFPSPVNDTTAMDLIFCCNVLMYFAPDPMRGVVVKLQRSLVEGGWLIVSPTEAGPLLAEYFAPVRFADATLYRRAPSTGPARASDSWVPPDHPRPKLSQGQSPLLAGTEVQRPPELPVLVWPQTRPSTEEQPRPAEARHAALARQALAAYEQGLYAEAEVKAAEVLSAKPDETPMLVLLAQVCANEGKLAEALTWCGRAIASDRLDASHHYLLAVIQQEQGQDNEALSSLRRTLYLDPDFVLAHFDLGNLMLRQGKRSEAARHFDHVLTLLDRYGQEDPLPEAGGLTAGRLRHMIRAMPHHKA